MKRFKKFILSMLLNKRERIIIWNALRFSNHTYRRRGNINGAVAVSQVMQRVEYILGVTSQRYTKEEVDKIVEQVIENIAKEVVTKRMSVGYDKGEEGADHMAMFVINGTSPDCENCEETDNCPIYKKIHAGSKEETETSVEETEKKEKDREQVPENK